MIFYKKGTKNESSIEKININDIYNSQVEEKLDFFAEKYKKNNNIYINELFIYFYRPYFEIREKIVGLPAYEVEEDLTDEKIIAFLFGINSKNFLLDWKYRLKNHSVNVKYIALGFWNILFYSFGLLVFILINSFLTIKPKNNNTNLILERSEAASLKLMKIKQNLESLNLVEKVKVKNIFYSYVRGKDLILLPFFLFKNTFIDLLKITKFGFNNFESGVVPYIFYYYSKRIPYNCMYEFTLTRVFEKENIKVLYTANNIDRFALVEEKLARQFNIKLVNFPHGIEYGFTLPHCFTGDKFYAYSSYSAHYLNKLYNTEKFVYSEKKVDLLLNRNFNKEEKFYVYFTEPKEININKEIIVFLKNFASSNKKKLFLKLHPKDNYAYYKNLGVDEIKNFDSSITNNICIARKSTILLEALYNNSQSIAVLLNEKDELGFKQFPSLNDKKIKKARSYDQLGLILANTLEENAVV